MWPKRATGGTQGESSSGIKVPLPPRSALTLIISNRQNDNVRYTCCCSVVVRARSAVNQCANHCNSFGERERESEREKESAREMWSSAEPAPAPAPAPIFMPGLCTNGRPTHLVTVKALPLSLPLLFARSPSLTHSRSTLCSALHVCASVYVCVCVSERACV